MKGLNHVVLITPGLTGLEYGMLADFQDELARLTGGGVEFAPVRRLPKFIGPRIGHGTRYSGLRRFVPKLTHQLKADVLWVALMGPESFSLDLFKAWDTNIGVKVLYLFDTMEKQLPSLRQLLRATNWDFTIASFSGAKQFLEKETQREWYIVPQGVNLQRFCPAGLEEKLISFCAYGRRVPQVHETIKDYCLRTAKHYEYTTAATLRPQLDPRENYSIYAWHLNHAIFNFCWPVELTNPTRVETFSPITCRWFEAASSGNVIIGQPPNDPGFAEIFGADLVIPVDPAAGPESLNSTWENLWHNRHRYLRAALERRARLSRVWSWESRVFEMLKIIGLSCEKSSNSAA